jgi:mono/diheme cytochrome c family protein
MLLRIVFWSATAIMAAALVLVLLANRVNTGAGPLLAKSIAEPELLARGQYLTLAGNCASCHTTPGGEYMAGGLAFETPFGAIYSTNISPDPETGIGAWSEREFLNSMRHGVRPDGTHLYPVFPYTAFSKVSNADVAAIFAYLQSIPAVSQPAFENDVAFPFSLRPLLAVWKALFFRPGAFEADPAQSAQWNRGAYLVEALAHCGACHTPRNLFGAENAALFMSGGEYSDHVAEGGHRPWSAPNLTATERGLELWSEEELASYLKTARNSFIESFGPMNEVIMNSTRYLGDDDIAAMARYIKGLAGVEETPGVAPEALVMGRGRTVYNLHCGTCHLPTGEGDPKMAPKLNRGSLVVQSDNPASMLNAILYGPESPSSPESPLAPRWREPMGDFQYLLDDEEVAAVATYIRNSWNNSAGLVTPEQVARQR